MWDHIRAAHSGDQDVNPEKDFNFKVLGAFKDPMTRQITEAVKIQRVLNHNTFQAPGGEEVQVLSLNRKYEHFAPQQRRQGYSSRNI